MRYLTAIVCLLIFLAPATAEAKRIDKMSTAQLISELTNAKKTERKIEAAQRLGETGAKEAIATLGEVCGQNPPEALCIASIEALHTLDSKAALAQVQTVLELSTAPTAGRAKALSVLMQADESRLREILPGLLEVYADMPESLLSELLVSSRLLEMEQLADAAVFIASDDRVALSARVAALDTAEHFRPPRLYQAHQALMRSKDSKVRARCAESLGEIEVPITEVMPLLKQVVRLDPEGYVRAAAVKSLAQYTHPDLLPLLHERLRDERHPVGFQATLDLSLTLADASTASHLAALLSENQRMKEDQVLLVVHKLAHLGDPKSIPAIFSVEQRHQGSDLAKVCRKVVTILEASELEAQALLEPIPNQPRLPTVAWDSEVPDTQFPPLIVEGTNQGLKHNR